MSENGKENGTKILLTSEDISALESALKLLKASGVSNQFVKNRLGAIIRAGKTTPTPLKEALNSQKPAIKPLSTLK